MTNQATAAAAWAADVVVDALTAVGRLIARVCGRHVRAVAHAAWRRLAGWLGMRPDAVTSPSTTGMRRLAIAALAVNAFIVVSGGVVRVTESGLGCPTWPQCTPDSLIPDPQSGIPAIHMLIEFGNRMVTIAVLLVSVLAFLAANGLRDRRPDLVRLGVVLPLGVVGQGLLGGVTVLSGLNPAAVGAHYLLSILVLLASMALVVRAGEGDASPVRVVGPTTWRLAQALPYAGFVLLVAGTVVTGSGPHAGDADAQRYQFAGPATIQWAARVHSLAMWAVLALTIVLVVLVRRERAGRQTPELARLARRLWILVGVIAAQATIGYVQYALGVPAGLVILHIAGSVAFWLAVLGVRFAARTRGELTTDAPTAELAIGRAAAQRP